MKEKRTRKKVGFDRKPSLTFEERNPMKSQPAMLHNKKYASQWRVVKISSVNFYAEYREILFSLIT